MSMTREEAVAAFLKDPTSVQTLDGPMQWVCPLWSELDPANPFNPDNWRLTPRPVPPGDLTWEEARVAQADGKKVQWSAAEAPLDWHDQYPFTTIGSPIDQQLAWRLKPEPKQVPLNRNELRPGTPIRWGSRGFDALVVCADDWGVHCETQIEERSYWTYEQLAKNNWADWFDHTGKTWRPCWKEES